MNPHLFARSGSLLTRITGLVTTCAALVACGPGPSCDNPQEETSTTGVVSGQLVATDVAGTTSPSALNEEGACRAVLHGDAGGPLLDVDCSSAASAVNLDLLFLLPDLRPLAQGQSSTAAMQLRATSGNVTCGSFDKWPAASVSVTHATGGTAPAPSLVTPDFGREARISIDADTHAISSWWILPVVIDANNGGASNPTPCPFPVPVRRVQVTASTVQRASDYGQHTTCR